MRDSCFNEYEDYSPQASIPRTIPVCMLKTHTKAIIFLCRISYTHYTLLLSYSHSMSAGFTNRPSASDASDAYQAIRLE